MPERHYVKPTDEVCTEDEVINCGQLALVLQAYYAEFGVLPANDAELQDVILQSIGVSLTLSEVESVRLGCDIANTIVATGGTFTYTGTGEDFVYNTTEVPCKGSYRYAFNGKEQDPEWQGRGNTYDYGFRIYNPRIAKFLSVDPLTKNYPSWSPYPFAMNRPIDGVDLDGLEWAASTQKGFTTISVNVILKFSPEINSKLRAAYKDAIVAQFHTTMKLSFGEQYDGLVTFDSRNSDMPQEAIVPTLNITYSPPAEGYSKPLGSTFREQASVEVSDNFGAFRAPEDVGNDAIHELLHTLRLKHPFEITQGSDTKLLQDGNEFLTTDETHPSIFFNIMNYGSITIDGLKLKELWRTQSNDMLTPDQLGWMMNEIETQKMINDDNYKALYYSPVFNYEGDMVEDK